MHYLIVHYDEIGIKGKNRNFFEKKLIANLSKRLDKDASDVYKRYGRIVCELNNTNLDEVKTKVELIPGVSNFMFAEKAALDIDNIRDVTFNILKDKKFETFGLKSRRSNKEFKTTSAEINKIVGQHIVDKLKKKVNLSNPDIRMYIEVGEKEAFIGYEKHSGIGGLAIGSSGKLISSLSGGIDSPVASFLMMKRGCQIVFVHIHNSTQTNEEVLGKLEDLVKQLTKIQLKSKLYIIPFEKLQKEIIMNVPAKYRMIIYRRFMMRIINEICEKEKSKGIVTGDSIGQVASQTMENLNCIYDSANYPVLSPLIGMNKEEITNISKKIGTYEYSIIPYPDCCSFMIAQHPETKGKLEEIKEIEKVIKNQDKLVNESIENAKIKTF